MTILIVWLYSLSGAKRSLEERLTLIRPYDGGEHQSNLETKFPKNSGW